jgi:hypothetical protein
MPKCHKFLKENKNKEDSEIHESLRRLLEKATPANYGFTELDQSPTM